ncbi:MAG TPA: ABC transporter substrate-binding protein, partial [Ignisphaera sp.]|nr:ABC transporter substrate-binding protein [Ignisphaera sp.]
PLTSPLVMDVLKDIPKEIAGSPMIRTDKEGNMIWVAAAIASFGITANKQVLSSYGFELSDVDEWKDLASPYFGVVEPPIIGVADATRSTSNTRMYEIIVQRYGWVEGWKIITLMGANARIYDESGLVRDAVIRGDIAAGITIDFYGYTAQLQNPNTVYMIPKDGSIVNGDPIALLKGCPYPEAAQAFIAWVLSPEGQTVWMDPNVNRMPINPKVFEVTEEGKKRIALKEAYERTLKASTIEFSDELALSYEEALRWFFFATITNAHTELREAWKAISTAYIQGKIDDEQLKKLIDVLASPLNIKFKDPKTGEEMVFSQETAQYVNKFIRDPNYRNNLLKQWTEASKERCEKALELLKEMTGG